MRIHKVSVFLTAISQAAIGQEFTQHYPSRPVTTIVAIAPGGAIDLEARIYNTKMSAVMGQPFVLDFKPGSGGIIGSAYVAKAIPDGYTLLVASGAFSVAPALYKDLPFDPVKDFAPISQMSNRFSVLVVRASFPAENFREYIAYAKANPGKINYGASGVGGTSHLSGAWLHGASNTKVTFIQYKGNGPLTQDLSAGRLDVASYGLLPALPLIKAGKIRILAIMSKERHRLLPDVLPIAEQGIPEFDLVNWIGYVAPRGTPSAIVNKLSDGFSKVARAQDVAAKLDASGAVLVGGTPAEFARLITDEIARWRKVVEDNDIKAEY